MKLLEKLLRMLVPEGSKPRPVASEESEPEEPRQLILPNFWCATSNYPLVEQQLQAIAKTVDGALFKVKNQFQESKLAILMDPGYLLVIGPEELGSFLTSNYILLAGDGTGRQLPGADLDFWQRLYRYLVSDRSLLKHPPISMPLYCPAPSNENWDVRWHQGTGLARLFDLNAF